ncbi:COPPER CHAPERONE putative-RELATED [Salix purpurea]|uniref:COPPER CHAPERONE putative-RELATED n=1 Tax=Salix purpurea TaxID=77065 RepID=A0A9Q1AD42_SALPP|nr:COPPER CHAPERONE putative-RELATED [Salix purpurea]
MLRNGLDQLLKVETHYLKVHINCEGCKQKVRKLLKKIDGVYSVNIKIDHQLVIVSGRVDSATLIKKLVKSGKRAELWSVITKNKRNQEQLNTNQLQFLAISFSDSQNQFMILMAATRMGNFYMDDDNFAGSSRLGDDLAYTMARADYQGNGTGFVGLGSHEFNGMPTYELTNRPSMIMTNKQQRYHYNHPATEMHSIYMQEPHTSDNMMRNDNFMYQPYMIDHASSTDPSYTESYPCY